MAVMRCLICNADMILVHVEPNDTMPVRGFEWRTFMCSECSDVERQLAFVKPGHKSKAEPVPVHVASSSGGQPVENEQPPPLLDTAASIVGEQSDNEQVPAAGAEQGDKDKRAPLMDAPSSISGEQSHNEQLMPPVDAGPSAAPPSAVLEERQATRGLLGRVVAKMRGQ
jgi:hypothetical protein